MTTDRRQHALRLYHLALAQQAVDVHGFLEKACAGDSDLRRDVEALLASTPPTDFLNPTLTVEPSVFLSAGTDGALFGRRIGPYHVDARLGFGGMGDVYRATDLTLGRQVAIKVLSPPFTHDPERRQRLEREAKTLAALNHPHIAQVYGLETFRASAGTDGHESGALVMELVTGEALAERLRQGPLPIDSALRYGVQIADALAAAHAHGIVHRDIKPGNVMITESGVKVLDFGLAKLQADASDGQATRPSPAHPLTKPHAILGTVAYMSPEQAEGKPAGPASDTFSLGVVLYEMLCGRRPFSGDNAIATLAATLVSVPVRPRTIRREIPGEVERIVLRCLEKNPESRFDSTGEVRDALSGYLASRSAIGLRSRAALAGAASIIVIVAGALGIRWYVETSRVQWVERVAIPEMTRLLNEDRLLAAATIYRRAEPYAPASRALVTLMVVISPGTLQVSTTPPGARVYISDYMAGAGEDLSGWQLLGDTPLMADWLPKDGHYRLRFVKEGFALTERTLFNFWAPGRGKLDIELQPLGVAPSGMAWVPPLEAQVPLPLVAPPITLPGFWIDRLEVTNSQFRAFVDAGGYQKQEYWIEPFINDGRTLSWQEGVDGFRDATNRPGPAEWQLGTYPEGAGDLPVSGVSWYEAAAYAAFAGKSLPTLHEWWGAALRDRSNSDLLRLSNFSSRGPAPVGAKRATATFGTSDMAGNVKEWVANPSDDRNRYLVGGSWAEESYVFTVADARTPFSREYTFGFRCVRRITPPPAGTLQAFGRAAPRGRRTPVDDRTFQGLLALHAYDKIDLEARVERVEDASPFWRKETISFRAGYDNDRVIAHLFLPKGSTAPYQVVALVGGSPIHDSRRIEDLGGSAAFEFILRAGRAVLVPALAGTLDRGPSPLFAPNNEERHRRLRWSVDMGRSLDYLETRPDIDMQRVGYYGVSMGAVYGIQFIAVDRRFDAAVLSSGGLGPRELPAEVDPFHFASRVRIPVLMLNGRDDFMVPYETGQRPLFQLLGSKEKAFIQYDGGHASLIMRPKMVGEALDWFDKHLGPVN